LLPPQCHAVAAQGARVVTSRAFRKSVPS
jgi:hypothetical protein